MKTGAYTHYSSDRTLPPDTIIIVSILFFSTLTRSTFGFGDALVAMPLLALLVPINTARPIVACVSVTTSIMILARDWRAVRFGSSWKIIVSAAIGIPIGFYVVDVLDERIIKMGLAVVILFFSSYSLLQLRPFVLKTDRSIWGFGVCAGVLSGAYNAPGPALVIFGTMRQWSREQFRATIQSIVLPLSFFLIGGHLVTGLLTLRIVSYYLIAIPIVTAAVFFGHWLHDRVRGDRFRQAVHVLLLATGTLLLVQSIRH